MCDYTYGLHEAIVDKVCRIPKIVLINSNKLVGISENSTKTFYSVSHYLNESDSSYLSLISHPDTMKYVLKAGCKKLSELRCFNPSSGGLVVASSIEHAYKLLDILTNELGQTAVIVTYHDKASLSKIETYRYSDVQWIVSIGMISEGTDIPRLQVCCHLSAIKTELYFRQVLGRILRINHNKNQEAWLYTIAADELTLFAERIAENLPQEYGIVQEYPQAQLDAFETSVNSDNVIGISHPKNIQEKDMQLEFNEGLGEYFYSYSSKKQLKIDELYQRVVDIFLYKVT